MKADAYRVLERAVEEALRFYLSCRVNKYEKRIRWTREFDGQIMPHTEKSVIKMVVDEAVDAIMTGVDGWFSFDQEPDDPTIKEK